MCIVNYMAEVTHDVDCTTHVLSNMSMYMGSHMVVLVVQADGSQSMVYSIKHVLQLT